MVRDVIAIPSSRTSRFNPIDWGEWALSKKPEDDFVFYVNVQFVQRYLDFVLVLFGCHIQFCHLLPIYGYSLLAATPRMGSLENPTTADGEESVSVGCFIRTRNTAFGPSVQRYADSGLSSPLHEKFPISAFLKVDWTSQGKIGLDQGVHAIQRVWNVRSMPSVRKDDSTGFMARRNHRTANARSLK